MDIAAPLEIHTKQELHHPLIISQQIDYLGQMHAVIRKPCTSVDGSLWLCVTLTEQWRLPRRSC
jgi:hypothetical protein